VVSHLFPVALARGKHLFPFRTEQLSPSAPMVLGPQGPGRVGRRRFFLRHWVAPRGGPSSFLGASLRFRRRQCAISTSKTADLSVRDGCRLHDHLELAGGVLGRARRAPPASPAVRPRAGDTSLVLRDPHGTIDAYLLGSVAPSRVGYIHVVGVRSSRRREGLARVSCPLRRRRSASVRPAHQMLRWAAALRSSRMSTSACRRSARVAQPRSSSASCPQHLSSASPKLRSASS
jgi:hypothetical protein